MALFLGTKRDAILSWRGTVTLFAALKGLVFDKAAYLSEDEDVELLKALHARLAAELALDERFAAASAALMAEIDLLEDPARLAPLHGQLNRLAVDYFSQRGSVVALHLFCASYRDRLVSRALFVTEKRMERDRFGTAPAPYSWLTLGSGGRQEHTLASDLDGLLVYGDAGPESTAYFTEFSRRSLALMEEAGITGSSDGVTPINSVWRGSLGEWQQRLTEERPEEERGNFLVRLADLRRVHGDASLASALIGAVSGALQLQRPLLGKLAKGVANMPGSLGFLGGFKVERTGAHRGEINLHTFAQLPLLANVRVLAIRYGIAETNTIARIKMLLDGGHLDVDLADRLLRAWHEITRQKVLLEVAGKGGGEEYFINPEPLTEEVVESLKSGLEALSNLQRIVYGSFDEEG